MLTEFNKIVLTIATIILIISLIILAIFMKKALSNDVFPPVISDCPDYWDVSYNNAEDSVKCIRTNIINQGSTAGDCSSYDVALFQQNGSSYDDILCEKYKWAKGCNLEWDGVTNNNKACGKSHIG